MVLCYEKKTLYSFCKTHLSFTIYNKNAAELLAQLLNSLCSVFLKNNFISVYQPIYFILLLHMYSSLLHCKKTNLPGLK